MELLVFTSLGDDFLGVWRSRLQVNSMSTSNLLYLVSSKRGEVGYFRQHLGSIYFCRYHFYHFCILCSKNSIKLIVKISRWPCHNLCRLKRLLQYIHWAPTIKKGKKIKFSALAKKANFINNLVIVSGLTWLSHTAVPWRKMRSNNCMKPAMQWIC